MVYFHRLIFGLIWVSPYMMICYLVLISKIKVHEVYIIWLCIKNTNILAVMELWVSEVGVWDKRSN